MILHANANPSIKALCSQDNEIMESFQLFEKFAFLFTSTAKLKFSNKHEKVHFCTIAQHKNALQIIFIITHFYKGIFNIEFLVTIAELQELLYQSNKLFLVIYLNCRVKKYL